VVGRGWLGRGWRGGRAPLTQAARPPRTRAPRRARPMAAAPGSPPLARSAPPPLGHRPLRDGARRGKAGPVGPRRSSGAASSSHGRRRDRPCATAHATPHLGRRDDLDAEERERHRDRRCREVPVTQDRARLHDDHDLAHLAPVASAFDGDETRVLAEPERPAHLTRAQAVPPQLHSAARRPTRRTAPRTSPWPRLLARRRPRNPGLDVERAVDETKGAPVLFQGRRSSTGSGAVTPSPSPIFGLATRQSPGLWAPDYITNPAEGKTISVMALLACAPSIPSPSRGEPGHRGVNYAAP
jgi:hypothetical protein